MGQPASKMGQLALKRASGRSVMCVCVCMYIIYHAYEVYMRPKGDIPSKTSEDSCYIVYIPH